MLEELKRKTLKSHIAAILLLLALSVGMLFVTDFGVFKLLQGTPDLDTLELSELEGKYVKAEIYFIYDWYAGTQSVNKSTNKATITEKEYIIPIGENEYMGLLMGRKRLSEADSLMEDSQKVLTGKTQDLGESFWVKGTVCKMDEESLEYYHEVVGYDAYTEEEKELFLPLVLKVDYIGRTEQGLTWFLTAVSALSLFGALWMFIGSLTGWYQRSIKAFCKASASPEALMEQLDAFYQNTEPVNGVRMGQWLMFLHGGNDTIVDSSDILWAYQRTVQHRTNGVPTGKSYGVVLRTRDPKKQYEIAMKNEETTRETLEALLRNYPRMVIGYTPELEKLYHTNREAFQHLTDPAPQRAPEDSEAQ